MWMQLFTELETKLLLLTARDLRSLHLVLQQVHVETARVLTAYAVTSLLQDLKDIRTVYMLS